MFFGVSVKRILHYRPGTVCKSAFMIARPTDQPQSSNDLAKIPSRTESHYLPRVLSPRLKTVR